MGEKPDINKKIISLFRQQGFKEEDSIYGVINEICHNPDYESRQSRIKTIDEIFHSFATTSQFRQNRYSLDTILDDSGPDETYYKYSYDNNFYLATVLTKALPDANCICITLPYYNYGFMKKKVVAICDLSNEFNKKTLCYEFPNIFSFTKHDYFEYNYEKIICSSYDGKLNMKFCPINKSDPQVLLMYESGYPYIDEGSTIVVSESI